VAQAQGGAGADAGARMEQSRGQGDTVCTGGSAGARTQGAGEGAADAGARVEQRVRGGAEWALEHRCAGMTQQGWSKHGADAGRFQTREQQRDAGQGRARFGRARTEVKRGGSGPTRTKGNEVAHGSTLAGTVVKGPATRQGRGECGPGNRRKKNNHAGRLPADALLLVCFYPRLVS
jgi:hypothetical protein